MMENKMFQSSECSYESYRKILQTILDTGKYKESYQEAVNSEKFVLLRHDIEFSVDRAYNLSLIENEMGIKSNWFVQITNNTYNAFSQKNIKLLQRMCNAGHHIGLHYHRRDDEKYDLDQVKEDIVLQAGILEKMLGGGAWKYKN